MAGLQYPLGRYARHRVQGQRHAHRCRTHHSARLLQCHAHHARRRTQHPSNGGRSAKRPQNRLQKRITAFNRAARYWFADVPGQLNGLPDAPRFNSNAGAFLQAFRDMQTLWTQYNALTGIVGYTAPLLLPDSTALAAFTTEFGSMEAAFNDATRTSHLPKTIARLNAVKRA